MATVRPARTYWDARATNWCYFDAVSGTDIVHNGSLLVIGTDNTNPAALTYYTAINFDTYTAPSWASDGPIAGAARAIILTIAQISKRVSGIGVVQIGAIPSAWDSSYSAAQMRTIAGATGFGSMSGLMTAVGRPEQWISTFGVGLGYGYLLRVQPGYATQGGAIRILSDPAPIVRHLYRYSPTIDTRVDATERATLSTDALNVLQSKAAPRYFNISANILSSEILPAEADTALSITAGANTGAKNRTMNWPETWQLDIPAAGAVPVSLVSDTISSDMRGMPVESELSVVLRDGTEEVIDKQTQVIGDMVWGNDGTGEIELRSPIDSILSAQMALYTPFGSVGVSYDTEYGPYIIADALMNSGKLLYKRIHYNDIVYLLRRFVGVFSPLSYTTSDLTEKTVGGMLDEIGPLFGLALAQSASGCIGFFHPSVYRPSIKVWTIDESDCKPGGYRIIDRGRDGQYGAVRVYDTTLPYHTTTWFPGALPSDPGFKESIFDFTAQGTVFEGSGYPPARDALGRQLSQRLCAARIECELELGLKGLPIECGDVVKVTGAGLSDTTRFLVYSVQAVPTSGEVTIKGVHYPDVLAMSNTFEDDGIKGEWRWMDETGTLDASNTAPSGTDPDADTCTLTNVSNEHWQGPIHSGGYAEWTTSVLISGTKHDVIDVCTMLAAEIDNYDVTVSRWGDEEYVPIGIWFKSGGTGVEALAFGIYRPGYTSGAGGNDAVTNRLFIGHIEDYQATPFTFTAVDYSPNGIAGLDSSQSDNVSVAFAFQWDDLGNAKLYVDRQLAVSGTGYSKDDWDSFRVTATGYDVAIGCVRHIQTDTEVTELQRLQGLNGLDPYQP